MRKIYILLFLFICFVSVNAQKQNYNWFFGYHAGVSWKEPQIKQLPGLFGTPGAILTDLPKEVLGSPMETNEGCFSISDANGELLFFSDGMGVWDKNMNSITNGVNLSGNKSSAQSGTIVVYPGVVNKYIIISLGEYKQNNLAYSIVEINNGIPVITQKNIPFKGFNGVGLGTNINQRGYLGESVTVGRHRNRKDMWVLAPGRAVTQNSSPFFLNVWKIDETGPQATLHSNYEVNNTEYTTNWNSPGGYVKFSNDSRHFAWINFGRTGGAVESTLNDIKSFLCYGDFDNESGTISNVRLKKINVNKSFGYGLQFTDDGKYLYLTFSPSFYTEWAQGSGILAYDFEELLSTNIQSEIDLIQPVKRIEVAPSGVSNSSSNIHFGSIQSGPDGRMYIPRVANSGTGSNAAKSLYILDNPRDPLNLRIYDFVFSNSNAKTYFGLPNFAVPWYNTGIEILMSANQICPNIDLPINFHVIDGEGFDKVGKIEIDFGDGSDLLIYDPVVAGIYNSTHRYKLPGIYRITVKSYSIDEDNNSEEIEITSVSKDLIVNTCALKVNPFIRGNLKTN